LFKGNCPKCGKYRKLTIHHIYPQRWFGKRNIKGSILICRECHNAIELLIPYTKQIESFYTSVVNQFLGGKR